MSGGGSYTVQCPATLVFTPTFKGQAPERGDYEISYEWQRTDGVVGGAATIRFYIDGPQPLRFSATGREYTITMTTGGTGSVTARVRSPNGAVSPQVPFSVVCIAP